MTHIFAVTNEVTGLHLVLSRRTKGIIGARELELMKPTAFLINTSRGALIDEDALTDVLERKAIAGAAIDVYHSEPLPKYHILRSLANVLTTPHIGYVMEDTYRLFYGDTVKEIENWLEIFNNK
jgi:phosphoglycerate dehydrogenase-like enzyme